MRRCPHCGCEKNAAWAQMCQDCGKPLCELPFASVQKGSVRSDDTVRDESPSVSAYSSHQSVQSDEAAGAWEGEGSFLSTQPEIADQGIEPDEPQSTPMPNLVPFQSEVGMPFDSLFPDSGSAAPPQPSPPLYARETTPPPPSEIVLPPIRIQEEYSISRVARTPSPGSLGGHCSQKQHTTASRPNRLGKNDILCLALCRGAAISCSDWNCRPYSFLHRRTAYSLDQHHCISVSSKKAVVSSSTGNTD